MNKWVVSAVASVVLSAMPLLAAGPATAPSAILDAIRTGDWGVIPQRLKLQSASAGALVEPDQGKVANWIDDYRGLGDRFQAERKKAYDNAMRDTRTLQGGGYTDLAMDSVAECFTLASDKPALVSSSWVKQLSTDAVTAATKAADNGEWFKARRIYSNLSVLEPTEPRWTRLAEEMFRRVRILTRYAPDSAADVLRKELDYRKTARKFLVASTQPSAAATQPEEKVESSDQISQNLKSDWKTELNGIEMRMLREALQDAKLNYYKDVKYDQLLAGGLRAMRVFATTAGMETAFPSIGDKNKHAQFLEVIDEQLRMIQNRPVDADRLNSVLNLLSAANLQTLDLPDQVLISEFADGAFSTLDPFSSMIWPNDMDEFRTTTQGEFSGVGIQIQDVDGIITVISPIEDSPALKAGIRAGDVITQINGKSAKGITSLQAKRQITGMTGTTVILTIRSPDDQVKDYMLTRQTIKVSSVKGWTHPPEGGWNYIIDADQKIAYVRLSNFTKESSNELADAIEKIRRDGAKAMILDLRGNPGGLLTAAAEVADKFLPGGKIVSTQSLRDLAPESRIEAHSTDDDVKLPMVVMVNQYSASASEIVSGALRDLKRATIVGERSFGKGSVQMLFPLEKQRAYLKLTTSHYYLPNGKCIHREENSTEWGVDPDLKVELTPDQTRKLMGVRSDLDVLRDKPASAAELKQSTDAVLDADLQLDAALLVLRLQLAGSPTG
ncbi:MAG TPA: S41 family peptidase [Tepidisphaeraceae bacterium]|jgi:carboxyl-terminal processing protease